MRGLAYANLPDTKEKVFYGTRDDKNGHSPAILNSAEKQK
jgi:hypothetical protein